MALNPRCPRCGSYRVQLTEVQSKHGCLWLLIFEWWYVLWIFFKWMIGLMLLCCIDWWMAIICAAMGKGYVFLSKSCFSGRRKYYFCHDCGHNFQG